MLVSPKRFAPRMSFFHMVADHHNPALVLLRQPHGAHGGLKHERRRLFRADVGRIDPRFKAIEKAEPGVDVVKALRLPVGDHRDADALAPQRLEQLPRAGNQLGAQDDAALVEDLRRLVDERIAAVGEDNQLSHASSPGAGQLTSALRSQTRTPSRTKSSAACTTATLRCWSVKSLRRFPSAGSSHAYGWQK